MQPRSPESSILEALSKSLDGPSIEINGLDGLEVATRSEIWLLAEQIASFLKAFRVGPGDRVVLMHPTSKYLVASIFAVWGCRAIIVPVAHQFRNFDSVRTILNAAQPKLILTNRSLNDLISDEFGPSAACIEDLDFNDRASLSLPSPEELALVQFSSGSTGHPKGICIRHRQLVKNVQSIGQVSRSTSADRFLSWLPLYHDMGLIGGLLFPVFASLDLKLIATERYAADPGLWIRSLSDFKATLTVAPPSAFALASRGRLESVDLSCLRYAWVGAEPIFPAILERFSARYQSMHLRSDALKPCYGLAEGTLAVTMSDPDQHWQTLSVDPTVLQLEDPKAQPHDRRRLIEVTCCGRLLPETSIEIVDRDGQLLPEQQEGLIKIKGPSVTESYLNSEVSPLDNGWFNTGDLGFIKEGQLFVTGREKEILKRSGQIFHPDEIEASVYNVKGVRVPQVVAFSVIDAVVGRELFVLLVETRQSTENCSLESELRRAVLDTVGVSLDAIVLLPPHSIPLTTSGKKQRSLCRERYLAGYFQNRVGSA
jgi:acyl-CoA synthetase (AMP-forming)/AMP-acid ligase II